jgi:hypothetical protein
LYALGQDKYKKAQIWGIHNIMSPSSLRKYELQTKKLQPQIYTIRNALNFWCINIKERDNHLQMNVEAEG